MIYVIFVSDYLAYPKISGKRLWWNFWHAHALPLCTLFGRCRIVSVRFSGASRAFGNSVWTPIYMPLYCISWTVATSCKSRDEPHAISSRWNRNSALCTLHVISKEGIYRFCGLLFDISHTSVGVTFYYKGNYVVTKAVEQHPINMIIYLIIHRIEKYIQ